MADDTSVSERELADDLEQELFTPRSVGEAIAADVSDPEVEQPPEIRVEDTREQPDIPMDTEPAKLPEDAVAEPEAEDAEEDTEEDTDGDDNIVWARKRYGDDPAQWAKGAREQDQHLSRLMNEKKEAENLAVHWYEAAQEAEQQAMTQSTMGMPLSAQEENWVETVAMQNPHQAARQAAFAGNVPLYNAVLERVAVENAGFAANIGAQVQMEMQQYAMQEQQAVQPRPLNETLQDSFTRLGIDLQKDGPVISEKIGELGEYHPYVQAILNGDDDSRDLALRAVTDLVREGRVTRRRVTDESREGRIQREAELRRAAAGVVTGAPHTPPPQEDPLLAAMTDEWKARRQWGEE